MILYEICSKLFEWEQIHLYMAHNCTHNHYDIPINHNVHINHIHIIHENIKMLALGTEAQPINKSIKITQHNMNTLCRYFRFPPAVTIGFA